MQVMRYMSYESVVVVFFYMALLGGLVSGNANIVRRITKERVIVIGIYVCVPPIHSSYPLEYHAVLSLKLLLQYKSSH